MGEVWKLIQAHQAAQEYRPSIRQIALRAGISPSALPKWQHLSALPKPENLHALARTINVPYRVLLEAALTDAGYIDGRPEGTPV